MPRKKRLCESILLFSASIMIEPLARVCAVGPGCKQAENRNKENPKKRWEFQGRIRYIPAGMLGG